MNPEILTNLNPDYRVLFAIESGSRAWGFASKDSDYDVRFVYVWPKDHYLRVHPPQEQLHEDLPGDLDITGWDLRKALHHFGKSNASFYEWINSPIVYLDHDYTLQRLRDFTPQYFQTRPVVHHYLGLAKQLWAQNGANVEVNGKWLLYVLRATLAAAWTLEHQAPPPVLFRELLPLMTKSALLDEVHALLEWKSESKESDVFPVSEELREYLARMRDECEQRVSTLTAAIPDYQLLDEFFQNIVA